jgi:opacity protein-like surface antigen
MGLRKLVVAAAVLALFAVPAQAKADWFFTPYVGGSFGGDTVDSSSFSWGASLGYMGAGIIGLEFDFNTTPNFFEVTDGPVLFDDSNVTTMMANLIVGAPIGGLGTSVRPYASAGVGLMRTRVTDVGEFFDVDSNDFGMNVGAGVMGFFTNNVGFRGDIRYFRNLADTEVLDDVGITVGGFDYWRGTLGVAFRF